MITVKKEGIILQKTDLHFENEGVLNPAAIREGEFVHLLYRAVSTGNHSSIGYCRLEGPLKTLHRNITPLLVPEFDYESHGIEDPRIVKIEDTYYLTFTAFDGVNALGCLATSTDMVHFERKGIIVPKISYEEFNALAETTNPFTNKVIQTFEEISDATLDQLVAQADSAFHDWKKTPYSDRASLLQKVAQLMKERKSELAQFITLEMGKLIAQAEGEIDLSINIFEYYAKNGEAFLKDKTLYPEFGKAYYKHTPLGTILGIEPWNFPFYQVARFAAPNLMIGNTVLLKHASLVPQCAVAIEQLFHDAGAASGIYTNLQIAGKRASKLVSDPRIKGVSLTGSEEASASIAEQAGKHIKKSVLELGGSDAFIVLEDADIDEAVRWGIIGRINNNGECCVASKRFIVVEKVAEEFLRKLKDKMKNLVIGNPMDAATELGPLSSEAAAVHLAEQVRDGIDAGATIILGGNRCYREGAFMEPTILSNIKPDNPIYYQELFGPVACFYVVKDKNEAILLANDSPYGLGCSIFTNNIERGKEIANQIDAGMVFINHPTWTTADLPFGGTKNSGYGRELSELGIQEFVNRKLIRISEFTDPM